MLNWFERVDEIRGELEGMENWFFLSIIVALFMLLTLTISFFKPGEKIVSLPINHVLIILAGISIVIPTCSLVIAHPAVNAPLASFIFGEAHLTKQVFPTIGLAGVLAGAIISFFGALWLMLKENNKA